MPIFDDHPIRQDVDLFCEAKCNRVTPHTVTTYKDEEIKTCHRCKTRTITIFGQDEAGRWRDEKGKETKEDEGDWRETIDRQRRSGKRIYRKSGFRRKRRKNRGED